MRGQTSIQIGFVLQKKIRVIKEGGGFIWYYSSSIDTIFWNKPGNLQSYCFFHWCRLNTVNQVLLLCFHIYDTCPNRSLERMMDWDVAVVHPLDDQGVKCLGSQSYHFWCLHGSEASRITPEVCPSWQDASYKCGVKTNNKIDTGRAKEFGMLSCSLPSLYPSVWGSHSSWWYRSYWTHF